MRAKIEYNFFIANEVPNIQGKSKERLARGQTSRKVGGVATWNWW